MAISSARWTWMAGVRAIVVTAAVLTGLVATGACVWRPDPLAALALVPPWCWFVAGLLSIIFVWRIRRPRIAAALAAFWLVFAIGWIEEARSLARLVVTTLSAPATPAEDPLRIVSLNCSGSERCLAELQRAAADVVLLQEAPGRDALARMTVGLFGDAGEFCTGGDVAILARGTVTRQLVDEGGAFVAASVRLSDGREIQCVSVRLAPPPSRFDPWSLGFWAEHRQFRKLHRRQLAQLMRTAAAKPESAVVIGGDFNTMPLDTALDELRPELADSFDSAGVGWGATGTNDYPLFRIDQIWVGSRLVPIRTFSRKTEHSDHRIVVCDANVQP